MKTIAFISVLILISGCSGSPPSGPSAEIRFLEDGVPMTNSFSLLTQKEVIRSNLVLGKTIDALGLVDAWGVDRNTAITRLRNALYIDEDPSHGTVTLHIKRLPDISQASILNTICEQIPKLRESVYDPTPVMEPREYDPKKHPDGFPQSANARTVQIQTEIVRRAE